MRIHLYIISVVFLLPFNWLYSQTFLNGSFEITSAPFGCNYNLSNPTFNGYMPNVNAYGAANEVDIQIAGCYVASIPAGTHCIGLAGDPTDQVAIALSAPLVAGNNYTFTFWSHSEVSFRVQGNVEIGASTNNSSFGTQIYTAVTVPSTWVQHTVNFVAPNATTHITVRNIAGAIHWNQVDGFVMGAPLPIELVSFDAALDGDKVALNWETASEINNDYFTLESSVDAIHFTEFARLNGAGNSNSNISYQSFDFNPSPGINYYRLKQTDFDGTFKYSDIKSISMVPPADVEVYPNPGNGNLTITNTNIEVVEIKIMNGWGELVRLVQMDEQQIDISDLPAGIYFMHISSGETTIVKRIIKQ